MVGHLLWILDKYNYQLSLLFQIPTTSDGQALFFHTPRISLELKHIR